MSRPLRCVVRIFIVSLLAPALACALAPAFAPAPGSSSISGDGKVVAATSEELPPSVFAGRRARLLEKLGADATVVLFNGPVRNRNGDVDFPYRAASHFWYLTGFEEPGAAALLATNEGEPDCTLFVPESNPASELWTGRRLGIEGARPLANEVLGVGALPKGLKERLAGKKRVLVEWSGDESRKALLQGALDAGVTPEERTIGEEVGRLRLVKSPEELALLQRSIDITCAAHLNAMRHAEPGMYEFEIQGVIEATYMLLGSPRNGFPCIVGSGRNSCILHYETNRELVPPQRTIVVDIGAEYGFYSADVTRTLPSSGKFTPEQRIVYEAVLTAQKAGIAVAKPGATLRQIERAARAALGEALEKGKVISNRQQAMALLPHGTCHWLGLEVHDDCPYRAEDGRGEVPLAPGMVTTVEPGCYIPAGAAGIDPKWHEIGVRIEDDVLITEDGCIVMSASAPREVDEIEQRMAEKSAFPRLLSPRKE